MSPSVFTFVRLALLLIAGCVGTTAPPAVILQLSQITRTRVTERAHEHRRELTFSAAVSVGLERVAAPPTPAVPVGLETATGLPIDRPVRDPPQSEPDATRCEPFDSAICAWARAAEESAWLAAIEQVGLPP